MAGTRTYRRQNMVQYTPTAYEQYAAAPMLLQQRADNTRAAIAQEQQALADRTFGLETEARNAKLQEYQDRIQGVIDAYGGDVARASRDIVPLIGQARNDPAWQHMERLEKERENFRLMQAEAASRGQIALNTGNYKQTIGEDGQLRSNFYNPETGEFNYDVSIQPDIFKVNYRGDQEERVNNIANSYITSTYKGTIDDLNSKIASSIATGRAHNEFGYLMSMEGFLPDEKRMAQEVQGYISSGIGQRHLQKLLLHDYANIPDKEEATRLAVTQMATEMIDAVKERENVQVKESSLRAYNPAAPTGGSGGGSIKTTIPIIKQPIVQETPIAILEEGIDDIKNRISFNSNTNELGFNLSGFEKLNLREGFKSLLSDIFTLNPSKTAMNFAFSLAEPTREEKEVMDLAESYKVFKYKYGTNDRVQKAVEDPNYTETITDEQGNQITLTSKDIQEEELNKFLNFYKNRKAASSFFVTGDPTYQDNMTKKMTNIYKQPQPIIYNIEGDNSPYQPVLMEEQEAKDFSKKYDKNIIATGAQFTKDGIKIAMRAEDTGEPPNEVSFLAEPSPTQKKYTKFAEKLIEYMDNVTMSGDVNKKGQNAFDEVFNEFDSYDVNNAMFIPKELTDNAYVKVFTIKNEYLPDDELENIPIIFRQDISGNVNLFADLMYADSSIQPDDNNRFLPLHLTSLVSEGLNKASIIDVGRDMTRETGNTNEQETQGQILDNKRRPYIKY